MAKGKKKKKIDLSWKKKRNFINRKLAEICKKIRKMKNLKKVIKKRFLLLKIALV